MSAENTKYWKFRFEHMETENYEDKHGPRSVNFKFVTFGAMAEETIERHEASYNGWNKMYKREQKVY